jgi:hypothetical protein
MWLIFQGSLLTLLGKPRSGSPYRSFTVIQHLADLCVCSTFIHSWQDMRPLDDQGNVATFGNDSEQFPSLFVFQMSFTLFVPIRLSYLYPTT